MPKQKLTPEKKNVISNLLEAYDFKAAADLQDALKVSIKANIICTETEVRKLMTKLADTDDTL